MLIKIKAEFFWAIVRLTMLWPDILERSARHSLRQTLYYLRQKLPEVAAKSLTKNRQASLPGKIG